MENSILIQTLFLCKKFIGSCFYRTLLIIPLDLHECNLTTHDCHDNATCNNTDGSYICECNVGYTGDGFNCTGTCKDL